MKTHKHSKTIIATILGILSLGFILSTHNTYAFNNICNTNAPDEVLEAAGCKGETKDELPKVVQNILYAVIGVIGLVAVVFILIGGINYMTSAGDSGKLDKAKKTILYACIGLVVCALAFAIVNWTISVIDGKSGGSGGSDTDGDNTTQVQDNNNSNHKTSGDQE